MSAPLTAHSLPTHPAAWGGGEASPFHASVIYSHFLLFHQLLYTHQPLLPFNLRKKRPPRAKVWGLWRPAFVCLLGQRHRGDPSGSSTLGRIPKSQLIVKNIYFLNYVPSSDHFPEPITMGHLQSSQACGLVVWSLCSEGPCTWFNALLLPSYKFFVIFEHKVPHFYFSLGPTIMEPVLILCAGFWPFQLGDHQPNKCCWPINGSFHPPHVGRVRDISVPPWKNVLIFSRVQKGELSS